MTDTTELIQRLRRDAYYIVSKAECLEAADALEQQAAQIKALRADAERYRFLKRNGITVYFRQTQTTNRQIHCQDMDFQIDAALRQEQPNE